MTKKNVSSVQWLLGATCILLVLGIVAGTGITSVFYGPKNLQMDKNGFYSVENFTMGQDCKAYSVSHCQSVEGGIASHHHPTLPV